MMPKEKKGVVDSRLNVYGVQGLKVAGEPRHLREQSQSNNRDAMRIPQTCRSARPTSVR